MHHARKSCLLCIFYINPRGAGAGRQGQIRPFGKGPKVTEQDRLFWAFSSVRSVQNTGRHADPVGWAAGAVPFSKEGRGGQQEQVWASACRRDNLDLRQPYGMHSILAVTPVSQVTRGDTLGCPKYLPRTGCVRKFGVPHQRRTWDPMAHRAEKLSGAPYGVNGWTGKASFQNILVCQSPASTLGLPNSHCQELVGGQQELGLGATAWGLSLRLGACDEPLWPSFPRLCKTVVLPGVQ